MSFQMNRRSSAILACAFLISGGASFAVYRLAGGMRNTTKALTTQVIVAARDLETGRLVNEADLMVADWAGPVPTGSAKSKKAAVNRGVVAAIYKGEPVTENRLALAGSGAGMAAQIPDGMRACAVRVNEVV